MENMEKVETEEENQAKYKVISSLIDNWLLEYGEGKFTTEVVWRHITGQGTYLTTEGKRHVAKKLNSLAERRILEKSGSSYRKVDSTLLPLEWLQANPSNEMKLNWPKGEDGSSFEFDNVIIYPGSVIVIAGASNMGKSLFALNFLVENMDKYNCVYFTNEFGPEEFNARMKSFDWVNLCIDGKPKFDTYVRYENFQDVVQPDAINIIDYLRIDDNFYAVGGLISKIKRRLKNGIALIALQKSPNRGMMKTELGLGGKFSQELARLYLSIDFESLVVVKAKAWKRFNPNNKEYRFSIIHHGARFSRIKEVFNS